MNINKEDYYVTVFSLKLHNQLKKKNIMPFAIETNKKFPDYQVFKYHDSEYLQKCLENYRKTGDIDG